MSPMSGILGKFEECMQLNYEVGIVAGVPGGVFSLNYKLGLPKLSNAGEMDVERVSSWSTRRRNSRMRFSGALIS